MSLLETIQADTRLDAVLDTAVAAYKAATAEQWERDGKRDCGSAGGYMLGYKGNSKFARLLVARGIGHSFGGGRVYVSLSSGYPTQHMEVECAGMRAFRAVTVAAGIEPSEARSYVD